MDSIQTQVRFTINNYSDALYFAPDVFATITPSEIDAMKQARYDAWVALVADASTRITPEDDLGITITNEDGTTTVI